MRGVVHAGCFTEWCAWTGLAWVNGFGLVWFGLDCWEAWVGGWVCLVGRYCSVGGDIGCRE